LLEALLGSDALVVLWSQLTYKSQFVPAEIGAVRATPRIGLLPVLIEPVEIPRFLQNLVVEHIPDAFYDTLNALAEKLDRSIFRTDINENREGRSYSSATGIKMNRS
jgi:hypothetical protein